MVQRDLVEAKLAELAHRLDRVVEHRPASAADLAGDEDTLDLVSFNLLVDPGLAFLAATEGVEDLRGFGRSIAAYLNRGR